MSPRLHMMINGARTLDAPWDADRAARVRERALHRRDARARRVRALRRGLFVAGGAAALVLALLRAASSAPAEALGVGQASPWSTTAVLPVPPLPVSALPTSAPLEVLAARDLADAGYARD